MLKRLTAILTVEEYNFMKEVVTHGESGHKFSSQTCYSSDGETPLWRRLEDIGLIECTGSYSWKPTDKIVICVDE